MIYNTSQSVHIYLILASFPFSISFHTGSFLACAILHGMGCVIHRWKAISIRFRMVYNTSQSVNICPFHFSCVIIILPYSHPHIAEAVLRGLRRVIHHSKRILNRFRMVYNMSESVHICLIPASLPLFFLVSIGSFLLHANLYGLGRVIHRWKAVLIRFRMVYDTSQSVKICSFHLGCVIIILPNCHPHIAEAILRGIRRVIHHSKRIFNRFKMVYNTSQSVHIYHNPASFPLFISVYTLSYLVRAILHGPRRVIHHSKAIENALRMVYNMSWSVHFYPLYFSCPPHPPQRSSAYCGDSFARTHSCYISFESPQKCASNGIYIIWVRPHLPYSLLLPLHFRLGWYCSSPTQVKCARTS